jgi:hypothetical protein
MRQEQSAAPERRRARDGHGGDAGRGDRYPDLLDAGGVQLPRRYLGIINKYVTDIAAASGANDNVYSIDTEYSNLQYLIHAGTPAVDASAFPGVSSRLRGERVL